MRGARSEIPRAATLPYPFFIVGTAGAVKE
jgi:hypothetical protein